MKIVLLWASFLVMLALHAFGSPSKSTPIEQVIQDVETDSLTDFCIQFHFSKNRQSVLVPVHSCRTSDKEATWVSEDYSCEYQGYIIGHSLWTPDGIKLMEESVGNFWWPCDVGDSTSIQLTIKKDSLLWSKDRDVAWKDWKVWSKLYRTKDRK